jgi:hypothetical protein
MADRLTEIKLPGCNNSGLADWGELTAPEMIKKLRDYATHFKQVWEKVLSASDEDFHIEIVEGVHVRRRVKILQEGRKAP